MIKFAPKHLVITKSIKLDDILAKKVEKMSSKKIEEIVQKVINLVEATPDSVDATIIDGTLTCTLHPSKLPTKFTEKFTDEDGNLCMDSLDFALLNMSLGQIVNETINGIKAAKVKGFTPQLTFDQIVAKVKLHKECLEECNEKMKDIWGDCLDEVHITVALNKNSISDEHFKKAMDLINEDDGKTSNSESAAQPS